MKRISYLLGIVVICTVITVAAIANVPLVKSWWKPAPPEVAESAMEPTGEIPVLKEEDASVMKDVIHIYNSIFDHPYVKLSGTFYARHATDSTDYREEFLFVRYADKLYYRSGTSEVLNLDKYYIAVDHDTKKLFLSGRREAVLPLTIPEDLMLETLARDHYVLNDQLNGTVRTFSITNQYSPSMRSYQIQYDTFSRKVQAVSMRLPESSMWDDANADRLVRYEFSQWRGDSTGIFPVSVNDYIKEDSGYIRPVGSYKDFELIVNR